MQLLHKFITDYPSKMILERYLLYLKNQKFQPSDAPGILDAARICIPKSGNIVIRDVRVARRFIEFDLSVPSEGILSEVAVKALSTVGDLDSYEMLRDENSSKEEGIARAIDLFNTERFWRCHEVLEDIWKRSEGEEKKLLNGIILVAAAFVHFQKGEDEICVGILRRAYDKIRSCSGKYHGINLDLLLENLKKIIDTSTIVPVRM
jgi:hypothetical protein